MKNQIIIGLGYRARSGKDTVANFLIREYGFTRIAFADKLKDVASIITDQDAKDPDFKAASVFGMSGGELLQKLGTNIRIGMPDIWIEASGLRAAAQYLSRIVVTDVRHHNEAAIIKELGGSLWHINRPGIAHDSHITESAGDQIKWDRVISNHGSLSDLRQAAIDAYHAEAHQRGVVCKP